MLILTASAKTLLEAGAYVNVPFALPQLLTEADVVCSALQQYSAKKLGTLMNISEILAQQTMERFAKWNKEHTSRNSRPALFCYNGEIFKAMHIADYTPDQLAYAHDHVRILSGLYGVLRACDYMRPYRLEMGTNVHIHGQKLVEYWQPHCTDLLRSELKANTTPFILDLASREYAHCIDADSLGYPIVQVDFLQYGKKGLQTYAIYAKHARGMMMDYCITTGAQTLDDVAKFTGDGYELVERSETRLVFVQKDRPLP